MKTRDENSHPGVGALSRKSVPLKEDLGKRLAAYAGAAVAAGAGLLVTAQPAQADIVYTPANVSINAGSSIVLDLNNDGLGDFTLSNHFHGFSTTHYGYGVWTNVLLIKGSQAGNGAAGTAGGGWAARLPAGATIGPAQVFNGANLDYARGGTRGSNAVCSGAWAGNATGYLGLEFVLSGQEHFGWASLNVSCGGTPFPTSATLTGYAYETLPNQEIAAGQTSSSTPEPGTLGLLALGSLALGFWRRRNRSQRPGARIEL